jgi:hypothetical protein
MPTKLTLSQQRALLRALPATRKIACKKHCQSRQMKGDGFMSIIKSIGKALGPIAKEIGPTVLKEFVLPMLKKKLAGGTLSPAGGALRLAGQRGRGKKKVSPRKKKAT